MKFFLRGVLMLLFITSCNTEQIEDAVYEQQDARVVDVRFSISESISKQSAGLIEDGLDAFIMQGYTIRIKGDVDPKYSNLLNVDLSEKLEIVVMGDVEISITHPDFNRDALSTQAYLGLDNTKLYTRHNDMNHVVLELVQGAVFLSAPEELDPIITDVKILGKSSKFDVMYFTAAEMVDVSILTIQGDVSDEYANILGEGKHYIMNSFETGLLSPEFTMNDFRS